MGLDPFLFDNVDILIGDADWPKRTPDTLADLTTEPTEPTTAGGKGSGNFGHAGRPGLVGGSGAGSPSWFRSLKKVGGPLGSNAGGVYQTPTGERWYVKDYVDPAQAFSEKVANDLYTTLGAQVPETVVSAAGRLATKWIPGEHETLAEHGLTPPVANKILDHYVADVMVANWDTVGTGHDNLLVHKNGGVTRVDQGGTLLFRAQGAPKPEAMLHKIGEWDTLSSPERNPWYAKVFHAAGLKNANALGQRAVDQINSIAAARPKGGWAEFVRHSVPHATAGFIDKVSSMLESRQRLLNAKAKELLSLRHVRHAEHVDTMIADRLIADAVIQRALARGDWGHKGRPGQRGGSMKGAAEYYSENSIDLNDKLRRGEPHNDYVKSVVKDLDEATQQHEITKPLYRYLPSDAVASAKPGSTITDKAFVSTSMSKKMTYDTAKYMNEESGPTTVMKILPHPGAKGLDIAKALGPTWMLEEHEIVLPRNSKFSVVSHNKKTRELVVKLLDTRHAAKGGKGKGKGKGDWGHKGRPGQKGGSAKNDMSVGGTGHNKFDVQETIEHYTYDGYLKINDCARGKKGCSPATLKAIDRIDAAFTDKRFYRRTTKPLMVYRGIGSKRINDKLLKMKGKIVGDKAFFSASRSKVLAEEFADHPNGNESTMLHISVPKGTKFLRGSESERERIFPRGTRLKIQRIEIAKSSYWGDKQYRFHAKMLKPKT